MKNEENPVVFIGYHPVYSLQSSELMPERDLGNEEVARINMNLIIYGRPTWTTSPMDPKYQDLTPLCCKHMGKLGIRF